ncbi:MAG TPA: PQQ-binding-like beta-propeller repeat protein [Gammaproteobacteria bacterium]|nr:PQQ-binding-like beta-propeller repeat protein [Gammaproteobacteria bacterium]
MTAFGQLLVSTRAGLHAVDPATGKVLWTHVDLAGLPEQGLQELAGSPLVMITGSVGLETPRTVVLNVFNGQLVFDTRIAKVGQISAPRLLPRAGSLLVGGFEIGNAQPTLFAYSMNDGSLLWKSDVLATAMNPGGNRLLGALLSVTLAVVKIDPVQSEPLELGDGTFLLGAMGHVMRLDAATGDVRWKTLFAGGVFEFRETDARPGVVYVGAQETEQVMGADQTTQQRIQTHYQGFRVDNGTAVWKRAVSFSKPMNRSIIALDRGLLVSDGDSDKGKLQLIDYDTGASLWGNKGRGIEVAGQVVEYSFAGTDLVLTTGYDSIWTNKDTAYLLYVLDTTSGTFRFPKPFEVKGRMLGTELTDQGLIYVTTHEINIFDPATGTLRNAPVLRSKAPLVTVDDRNLVYAFNSDDGFVYSFDRDTGAVVKLSQTPFALDKDDHARALDLVDGTLVLMGQQTVAGFGLDGSQKFAVHYDAPRNPTWMRALAWAEGVRMGMASVSAGMYSAAFADAAGDAAQGSAGREVATELSRGFGDLSQGYQSLSGDYIRFARRRYEASAESRDFFFMMVQHEDRRVALAQISKRDGRILSEIDLGRDKEPAYQVDDVGSSVYYRPADSVVAGYRFAPERVALR